MWLVQALCLKHFGIKSYAYSQQHARQADLEEKDLWMEPGAGRDSLRSARRDFYADGLVFEVSLYLGQYGSSG